MSDLYQRYLDVQKIKKSVHNFDVSRIAFKQQLGFIGDPSRLKALFCTRRAAKSYTGGLYLVKEALDNPGCNCLFIGLTRQSAHGIIWKDILREIDRKYQLNMKFNETLLTATFPNGSVIWCVGADSDESEMNKLLGRKYRLVILDEASMFSVNMHQLVYGVLKPATADNRGTICLLGTASNITRGLFYDITCGKEPGWSVHTWTALDNPHVAKQWQEELDDIKINRPLFMKTALFRQWMLNEWVIDEDAKVYKYKSDINRALCLPTHIHEWNYVLGVDLAHSPDSTAFVVSAYNSACPILFFPYARKHLKMDLTDVATERHRLNELYKFEVEVADGSNKIALAELNNRLKCKFLPADKTGKADFIKIMNDEFVQGNIKLLPGAYNKHEKDVDSLSDEYDTLVWEQDNGKIKEPRKENQNLHNDLADSGLYNWRYTYTYLWKPTEKEKNPHAQESWEPLHIANLAAQVQKDMNPNHFDNEFMPDQDLFDFDQDNLI